MAQRERAADPVRERVVQAEVRGDAPALEAREVPGVPQRPAAVELVTRDGPDRPAELGPAAGGRDLGAVEVVIEAEVGVLDGERSVEPAGHLDDPLAKGRHLLGEMADEIPPLVVAEAVGRGAGVGDDDHADVHVPGGRLRREHVRVDAAQPAHVGSSGGETSSAPGEG